MVSQKPKIGKNLKEKGETVHNRNFNVFNCGIRRKRQNPGKIKKFKGKSKIDNDVDNKKQDIYSKMICLEDDIDFKLDDPDSKRNKLHYLLICIQKEKNYFLLNGNRPIHIMDDGEYHNSSDSNIVNHRRRTRPEESVLTGKKKTALDYLLEQTSKELQELKRTGGSGRYRYYSDEIDTDPFPVKKYEIDRKKALKPKILSENGYPNTNDIFFKMIIRSGKRIYPCPEHGCSKAFPSLSRVKRHYIVHTGEKPFKCINKECNKTFSRKDNMIQHYKSHCMASKRR
ncbi:Zinc finger C2H2 protein [Spraguea lophii 42_110]|uniref:Zinc finger C2H2 protein n=1 Tax=Spraguea lophii (strain 42_110) TaxID=1358809 RepID=S7W8U2_SPRLO|nr:Zinc finger C2H2 protein [Spraguea lophii 42_110]